MGFYMSVKEEAGEEEEDCPDRETFVGLLWGHNMSQPDPYSQILSCKCYITIEEMPPQMDA